MSGQVDRARALLARNPCRHTHQHTDRPSVYSAVPGAAHRRARLLHASTPFASGRALPLRFLQPGRAPGALAPARAGTETGSSLLPTNQGSILLNPTVPAHAHHRAITPLAWTLALACRGWLRTCGSPSPVCHTAIGATAPRCKHSARLAHAWRHGAAVGKPLHRVTCYWVCVVLRARAGGATTQCGANSTSCSLQARISGETTVRAAPV